jgi:response regulator RpfG family c-di-GMP phosphodiesterase
VPIFRVAWYIRHYAGGSVREYCCAERGTLMMTIAKELMRDVDYRGGVITLTPQDTISTAAKIMRDEHVGCIIVIGDDRRVEGIVSERDIVVRVMAAMVDSSQTLVGDIMTTPVVTCTPMTHLDDIRELMSKHRIRHVAVIDGDRPVGMISSREILARRLADDQNVRNLAIFSLARLAETRDTDTGAHLERVREYARILAEQLQRRGNHRDEIDDLFVELIYVTCPLHDIGKVSIPDAVLLKPGRLNEAEYEIMKTHSAAGAETLGHALNKFPDADFLRMARNIACHHHERVDGTGYPDGLSGNDIPLAARIFAVVDVYDALVSKRVYKEAFTPIVAKDIILEGAGTQFDVDVIEAFIECEPAFIETYRQYAIPATAVA